MHVACFPGARVSQLWRQDDIRADSPLIPDLTYVSLNMILTPGLCHTASPCTEAPSHSTCLHWDPHPTGHLGHCSPHLSGTGFPSQTCPSIWVVPWADPGLAPAQFPQQDSEGSPGSSLS